MVNMVNMVMQWSPGCVENRFWGTPWDATQISVDVLGEVLGPTSQRVRGTTSTLPWADWVALADGDGAKERA